MPAFILFEERCCKNNRKQKNTNLAFSNCLFLSVSLCSSLSMKTRRKKKDKERNRTELRRMKRKKENQEAKETEAKKMSGTHKKARDLPSRQRRQLQS